MTGIRLSYRLIGFISTMILARLLTPEDFGVVAIAMSFFAFIDIFSRLGFQTALIQNQQAEPEHYHSAWTMNAIVGLVAGLLLVLSAEAVGMFYENDAIEEILWVISLLFVLEGLKNIGAVDFQKNLTFDKEFRLIVIPKFISFFVTIGLALYFLNYWALVIGNIFWKSLEVFASYKMHPFRPRVCFTKTRELFGYSKWLMVNNVFNFLYFRSPELLLGKFSSPRASAIYALSYEIGATTTVEIISNLNRAIFPGYAKVAHDLTALQDLYKNSIRAIALFAMPLGVGVALVTDALVPIFLGDQWGDVVEPLVYIAIGGGINALGTNVGYVYYALGRPKISTFELGLKALLFVTLMYFMIPVNGVVGAAQSFLMTAGFSLVVSWIVLSFVLKLSIYQQLALYLRPLLASTGMVFAVSAFRASFTLPAGWDLLCSMAIGAVVYVVMTFVLWVGVGRPNGAEGQAFMFIANKLKRGARQP